MIAYGQLLNEIISFLIVALAVFVVVKQANRFKPPERRAGSGDERSARSARPAFR